MTPTEPFGPGSVSLRLYPHDDLDAPGLIEEMRAQAVLAVEHGFHGVMTSEHHGGFGGYIPNPLQAAGWMLDVMPAGWAAPCPMVLPLRPVALVAEEAAWLAARFPGRVGIGVAAGGLAQDFELLDMPMDDLTRRFADGLASLTRHLRGEAGTDDQALRRCIDHPVPVVSAAMGFTAARRAAACGAGLVFDSMSSAERVAALIEAYRAAGGVGPTILIRRAWVGAPPAELFDKQIGVYRTYATTAAQSQWEADELISGDDVAERLRDAQARSTADALNVRLHVPGVRRDSIRDQIELLGRQLQ